MQTSIKAFLWDLWVRNFSNLLNIAKFNRQFKRILIYHHIDDHCRENFKRQMSYFVKNYRVLTLTQFIKTLQENTGEQESILCITFDDAYKSVYENACPVLDEYNIKPCIFVPAGFIEAADKKKYNKNNIRSNIVDDAMSWRDLKNLVDRGYEIGSHSFSHVNFGKGNVDYELELLNSRLKIQDVLGCKVEYFAFPFGKKTSISRMALDKAKEYGYRKVFSGIRGNVNIDKFLLARTYINPSWKENVIRCMLAGYFDE